MPTWRFLRATVPDVRNRKGRRSLTLSYRGRPDQSLKTQICAFAQGARLVSRRDRPLGRLFSSLSREVVGIDSTRLTINEPIGGFHQGVEALRCRSDYGIPEAWTLARVVNLFEEVDEI